MQPEVIESAPVTCAEVKNIIETTYGDNEEELSFRLGKTKDYVNVVSAFDGKQAAAIMEELSGLDIARLKPEHMVKLIDLNPFNADDVKNILSGYSLALKAEQLTQIADIFDKHRN